MRAKQKMKKEGKQSPKKAPTEKEEIKKSKEFSSDDVFSGLSAETIKALREFALQSGVAIVDQADDEEEGEEGQADQTNNGGDLENTRTLLKSVQRHFQVQDREEIFHIDYTSKDGSRRVTFDAKGVKRELGQTLQSTGLTIWRAAEHLSQYIIDHPEIFTNKTVCELGAGLGLVSILVDKLNVCKSLVATDGDEDTLTLLIENQIANDCTFDTAYLLWGEHEDFASDADHHFDVIIAADVIYEDDQIEPLLDTVQAILNDAGVFLLAYARRNVPVDRVLEQASRRGLVWEIVSCELYETEPIYCFRKASSPEPVVS